MIDGWRISCEIALGERHWTYWWQVYIGSYSGWLTSGNKPLPGLMLTQMGAAIWRHWAAMCIQFYFRRNLFMVRLFSNGCTRYMKTKYVTPCKQYKACVSFGWSTSMFLMSFRINLTGHDDVIKWKHFPRYWPFVKGIHRSMVGRLCQNSTHWARHNSIMLWYNFNQSHHR